MSTEMSFEVDILVRLLAAAAFGAGLGFEREVHGHQAGMRGSYAITMSRSCSVFTGFFVQA